MQDSDSSHLTARSDQASTARKTSDPRMLVAMAGGLVAGLLQNLATFRAPSFTVRRDRKSAPHMVTSSPAEIAAWNEAVEDKREPKAKKPKRIYPTGQHPKLAEPRKHIEHSHPLRDQHGAYTFVGLPHPLTGVRRKWLAGISAQRGY